MTIKLCKSHLYNEITSQIHKKTTSKQIVRSLVKQTTSIEKTIFRANTKLNEKDTNYGEMIVRLQSS